VLTVGIVICSGMLFRQSARSPVRKGIGPHAVRFDRSGRTLIPLTSICLFLAGYISMTLFWEDFAWYGNSQFTEYSIRGIDFPVYISPEDGRFLPLSLQEFNVIGHFTKTVAGYHAFSILELLVLASILLVLCDELSVASRVFLITLALVVPSVVISFTGLIYTERDVILLLVCLALFVKLFEQNHSAWWAVAAVFSSQVMLYLKEPVFLLLLGFSASRLILRLRNFQTASWNVDRLRDDESRLDLCIAAVSILFLVYYVIKMFPRTSAKYLVGHQLVSSMGSVAFYFSADPLAWVFAAVVAIRMYRIFRGMAVPQLLWDGLACGGVVYFAAYIAMRLTRHYYVAPADLIAVIYLGHLLHLSWGAMRWRVRAAAAALVIILVGQNLEVSAFWVINRKHVLHQKSEIASTILERYTRSPNLVRNLYFPFTEPYMLMEFAAYLSYRGVPVEDDSNASPGEPRVEIFGGKIVADGRCQSWTRFMCHAGAPDAGRMVIVLPDDTVSPVEAELYRESENTLRSYNPRIQAFDIPTRMLRVIYPD
jgi:hypothetical protein